VSMVPFTVRFVLLFFVYTILLESELLLTVSLGINLENKTFQFFTCVYYFGNFVRFHLVEIKELSIL